jgi:hypothetical protein
LVLFPLPLHQLPHEDLLQVPEYYDALIPSPDKVDMTIDHVRNWLKEEIKKHVPSHQQGKRKQGCRPASYDSSGSDSDGDFAEADVTPSTSVATELLKFLPFLTQLKECVAMNFGFHCDPIKTWCYCPCGKHMKTWRDQFKLKDSFEGAQCKADSKFTPNALMDHLGSGAGKTTIYHQIVFQYLKALYGNYFPNKRRQMDHFALYSAGSRQFKESVAELKQWIKNVKEVDELLQEPTFPDDSSKPYPEVPAGASSPARKLKVTDNDGKALTTQHSRAAIATLPSDNAGKAVTIEESMSAGDVEGEGLQPSVMEGAMGVVSSSSASAPMSHVKKLKALVRFLFSFFL